MKSSGSAAAHQRRPLVVVGCGLGILAAVTWMDALRLSDVGSIGVGPAVSMKLIGSLLGLLGAAHLLAAFRPSPAATPVEGEPLTNRHALAWVLGGLMAMIGILVVEAGFILAAAIVFVCTARAFGKPLISLSPVYGLTMSILVYAFFTKGLTLALPSGPLERLLFA